MKHEDQNIEYKQSWREEYLKWICGFANVGSLPDDWTVKRLLGKHSSRPRNPTIAGCVYLTGMIETWGRGIRKVFDECKKHGCPPPVYEVSAGDPGDIMVRIDAAPDAVVFDNGEESIKETLKDGRPIKRPIKDELFDTIKATPGITRPQLMSIVGKGRTVVTEALALLQKDALIEHRGSRKTGGYYVKTR